MTDIKVSQEARQAAAGWAKLNSRNLQAANILRGSCDSAPIVQAFARFEAQIRAEGWRPIETAPRDGSEFLGYHLCADAYTGDWYALVEYSGDQQWPWEDQEGRHPRGFLTHWMPPPAPPTAIRTGGQS